VEEARILDFSGRRAPLSPTLALIFVAQNRYFAQTVSAQYGRCIRISIIARMDRRRPAEGTDLSESSDAKRSAAVSSGAGDPLLRVQSIQGLGAVPE
jgi:hypothetical protein